MAVAKIKGQQRADVLDYRNETDEKIPCMTVLQIGDIIGIAGTDIEPGELGSAYIEGVFYLPKAADAVIAQGARVVFDGTVVSPATASAAAQEDDETETADVVPAGVAAYSAAAADTAVAVILNL